MDRRTQALAVAGAGVLPAFAVGLGVVVLLGPVWGWIVLCALVVWLLALQMGARR